MTREKGLRFRECTENTPVGTVVFYFPIYSVKHPQAYFKQYGLWKIQKIYAGRIHATGDLWGSSTPASDQIRNWRIWRMPTLDERINAL